MDATRHPASVDRTEGRRWWRWGGKGDGAEGERSGSGKVHQALYSKFTTTCDTPIDDEGTTDVLTSISSCRIMQKAQVPAGEILWADIAFDSVRAFRGSELVTTIVRVCELPLGALFP